MRKRILFLADPNSIHDLKWMQFFSRENDTFLLVRKIHMTGMKISTVDFYKRYHITITESITDFSVTWFWKNIIIWNTIRKVVIKNRIDIFHVLYAEPNALIGLFEKFFAIPFILTTRGTDILKIIPETFSKKDLLNRVVTYAYKNAFQNFKCITCTSEQQINVIKKYKLTRTNPVLLRTGIDTKRVDRVLRENGAHPFSGKEFIFFSRNMRPLYNHELALESIRLLPMDIIKRYHMVFIDADSSDTVYVKKIKALMATIQASFIFLDNQPQEKLWILNKEAGLVVMTPKSDGSPVSAIEALYCGANVVLPPLQYDSDLFNINVMKFSTWDAKALALTIVEALQNSATSDSNIKKVILDKADTNNEMSKLNLIYENFLSNETHT